MQEWLQDFADIKESTRQRYQRDIRLYIEPCLGRIALCQLTAIEVQKLYRSCRTKGLSPKSIRNLHGILHEALSRAVKLEMIKRNVSELCDLPKMKKVEMHPLKDGEVQEFIFRSKDDEFAAEYYVAMFSGLRESEVVGLTWDCIDFEHNMIRVYRQYVRLGSKDGKTVCKFTSCKNDRERTVEVAKCVMDVLKHEQQKQKTRKLKVGKEWSNPNGFVFTKSDGSPIQYQTMYKHFKKIVTEMGKSEVRFHDLRHTYATIALQNGVDVKTLSASLGHATVAFTLDRYGHVSDTMRHEAA